MKKNELSDAQRSAIWGRNPSSIAIEKMQIDANTTKTFELAPGGGLAISLMKQ